MENRKALAVAVALAVSSLMLAQDTPPTEIVESASEDPRRPIMQLLDSAGVGKTLDENRIDIGGWLAGSVTWSLLDDPAGDVIVGRAFDFEHADPTFNQFGFFITRPVEAGTEWDAGFTFESIFGADARFISSNGMDFQTGPNPENQFDITQLYLELSMPVGRGLTLKIGKWATPIGYEYVNTSLNPLYSRSYLFGIVPFSHTGVIGTYPIGENSTFSLGIARGWEQSLKDNNGDAIEVVFSFANTPSDQLSYALNGSVGPQNDNDSSHYRTMLDFWLDYACSDQFSFGLNLDYRYDSADGQDGDAAHTYGAAGYFRYECNKYATLATRVEWFNDTSRVDGLDCNVFAATFGVTLTPFPDDTLGRFFQLRPEIRYDYATEPIYDGGSERNLVTVAIEAVFTL